MTGNLSFQEGRFFVSVQTEEPGSYSSLFSNLCYVSAENPYKGGEIQEKE